MSINPVRHGPDDTFIRAYAVTVANLSESDSGVGTVGEYHVADMTADDCPLARTAQVEPDVVLINLLAHDYHLAYPCSPP